MAGPIGTEKAIAAYYRAVAWKDRLTDERKVAVFNRELAIGQKERLEATIYDWEQEIRRIDHLLCEQDGEIIRKVKSLANAATKVVKEEAL